MRGGAQRRQHASERPESAGRAFCACDLPPGSLAALSFEPLATSLAPGRFLRSSSSMSLSPSSSFEAPTTHGESTARPHRPNLCVGKSHSTKEPWPQAKRVECLPCAPLASCVDATTISTTPEFITYSSVTGASLSMIVMPGANVT